MVARWKNGEETFFNILLFQTDIINHVKKKNQTNIEKPAIGVEPMTIALQMRCSNL